jgi:hypothetical protein
MTLAEALGKLLKAPDDQVVFAKRPWALDSDAIIGMLDDDFGVPVALKASGYEYVLDAPVAREVLEVFEDRVPSEEQIRALLFFYAENDAYPDWVYEM